MIRDLGDSVLVTAERPWPDEERNRLTWLWVSADGVTWNGGARPVPEPSSKPARVSRAVLTGDGAIVANLHASDWPEDQALRTTDGGRTWAAVDCSRGCDPQPQRVGRLWVRDDGFVSVDGGETWQFPQLPGIGEDDLDGLEVVENPGRGWFAVATVPEDDGTDGWDERFLLRSPDGVRWELVFEADSRCWTGFPGEWKLPLTWAANRGGGRSIGGISRCACWPAWPCPRRRHGRSGARRQRQSYSTSWCSGPAWAHP